MKEFILLYKGPTTPMENMSPEKGEKILAGWNEWIDELGDSLLDIGQPMTGGIAVADDDSQATATELSGYSIIQAKNLGHAQELAENHPFLSENKGNFSVEIHELLPAPMEL